MLDDLLIRLKDSGTDSNLVIIDSCLREAGAQSHPRLLYFLRRYRCEQLYYHGLLEESMVEAEKARRISIELQDSLLVASSLNQVAVLLEERRENADAIALLREALRWYPSGGTSTYPITLPHRIHGNLGLCYANNGQLDSARACQERSLQLAEKAHVPRGEALALLKLGNLSIRIGALDKALHLLNRASGVASANGVDDVHLDILGALAETLIRSGRQRDALSILDNARTHIAGHQGIAQRSLVAHYDLRARLLPKIGRYQDAMYAAHTWRTLDSTLRANSARTAQRTLATLRTTDLALTAERSRAELTMAQMRTEQQVRRTVLVAGMLAVVLLTTIVVIIISRSRQKDRIAQLAFDRIEQDRQIADLRVRQQVSADLHDDLGAGLSALKLHTELAADLSSDGPARDRDRALARIAGDLIATMRHILWSLGHSNATMTELVTYATDRARTFCAELDRPLRITMDTIWPLVVADPELRYLAWIIVREALQILLHDPDDGPIELAVHWRNGLAITISGRTELSPSARKALASAMSMHQFRVSRNGGTLRTLTEGSTRLEVWLAMPADATDQASSSIPGRANLPLALFLSLIVASTLPLLAQVRSNAPVVHLDSLFTLTAIRAAPSARLQLINTAIATLSADTDSAMECHLLLARAKIMYYRGLFHMGIADANKALLVAQQLTDSLLVATAYNMIGLLHENLGGDAVTLTWFREAERWLPKDSRSRYPVVQGYHVDANIGQCLLNLNANDSAAHHFARSLAQASAAGDLRALAIANLGTARTHLAGGDALAALVPLDSACSQALRDGSKDVYVDAFPARANAYILLHGHLAGDSVLNRGADYLRNNTTINPVSRRNFLLVTSGMRERIGAFEKAMTAWREWQMLDSTITVQDGIASLAALRAMLDNDQRLQHDRASREASEEQLRLVREQRRTFIGATGGVFLLMLGLTLLYASRRRNVQRLAAMRMQRSQAQKELAELLARQRLSEEMHQELGTGLEAMKLRSELALEVELDPDARQRLSRINAQAKDLVGSMRQIIWALDAGQSSLAETVRFTAHYASTYCAQQQLHLHLNVPTGMPQLVLSMEQRRNIFLVVKEALHNVVKHARATEVTLNITGTSALEVRIADNGRGPSNMTERTEGNGLRNMRKRIEAIGGTFITTLDKGMVLQFSVPLSHNNGSTEVPRT